MPADTSVSTWAAGNKIASGMEGVPDVEILEVRNNGTGAASGVGSTATLKYKAMLADGTVKDPGTRPFTFKVGAGRAIKGWDVIVQEMRVGDSFVAKIPEGLAYPGQGDWKFEMELLSFDPPADTSGTSNWAAGGTIPSGMTGVPDVEILEVRNNGSGAVCGTGSTATLKYKAMLADGTVKDPGTRPFTFKVGAGRAIKGWDVIVSKMRVGDSFVVKIPEGLAYAGQGDWKFEMELLSFK